MPLLKDVWQSVVALLDNGISVIPIRDKDEVLKSGKVLTRKSPYSEWTEYQSKIISKEQLWYEMERRDTTAIATICGKISGNLEAIDIDVKFKPDAAELLFQELSETIPDVAKLLRIHKTPSGGYHLLYRCNNGVIPGNKKLAERPATPEELSEKPKEKNKCFIETRGEGGYVAAPPSLGYTVIRDNPIPTITWDQREQLISICTSFNEVIREDKVYNPTNQESLYYSQNPFDHFNHSNEAESVLLQHGWTFEGKMRGNRGIYFTRPGSRSGGIHAVYFFEKRLYQFFTTNSEFDTTRRYFASTVLSILAHGGDKKQTFKYLVGKGYGQLKPEAERKLVQRKVLAGDSLPENVSSDAREEYQKQRQILADSNPFGIFWELDEKGKITISRERLYDVAHGLGFGLYNNELIQIDGRIVHRREQNDFISRLKSYIRCDDPGLLEDVYNTWEEFSESHGKYTISRLRRIESADFVRDDSDRAYKFYQDRIRCITRDGATDLSYDSVVGLIWADRIAPRPYRPAPAVPGLYTEFLSLAAHYNTNPDYIRGVLGYLAHDYKDEAMAYIIVITEECSDPKEGGGSGKNVFCNLLSLTTTINGISGTQVSYDSKFLQAWDLHARIFVVSDVPKKFDFSFLKELASGQGVIKKLYKDEMTIPVEKMPKFIIQTNYSYDVTDGGLKRRIIPLEFTDFFTNAGGIDAHFGCYFPRGWSDDDYADYDAVIEQSLQHWFRSGRKLYPKELTYGGSIKQFDLMYPSARDFMEQHWDDMVAEVFLTNSSLAKRYADYCLSNNISKNYQMTAKRLGQAIIDWATLKGCRISDVQIKRTSMGTERGRTIELPEAPF